MNGLPKGWVKADLGAVATVTSGIGFPNEHQGQISGDLPFVKVGDVSAAVLEHGGRLSTANHYVSREVAALLKGQPVRPGATVFAKIGEAIRLNRRAYVVNECLIDNNVMAVTATDERSDRYVHYFLRTVQFADVLRATTVPSLRKGDVESVAIPLAPLPEQKRIADKLDSVLARVDACRDRLDRIPALLKRFRQSVLAAATSGRLTADWRNGEDVSRSWKSMPLGDYVENHDGRRVPIAEALRAKRRGDYPYYGASGVIDEIDDFTHEGKFLLVGEDGANLVTRSKPIAFIAKGKIWVNNHAHVLKCRNGEPEEYLGFYLNAIDLTPYVSGSAQPKLNQKNMNLILVPVPPVAEQHEIVRRVETLFAFADRLEARCAAARKQAGQLTPALLAKAFRGELAPQDPADEPAAELLKRLAARRAEAPKTRRGRKPVAARE